MSNILIQIDLGRPQCENSETEKVLPSLHIKTNGLQISNFVLNDITELVELRNELNKIIKNLHIG